MSQIFTCSNCDAQFSKWSGQCEECGKWGTISTDNRQQAIGNKSSVVAKKVVLQGLELGDKKASSRRISSGISEVDTVLGGGFQVGSIVLLGGEPGIGKSTLVAQIAAQQDTRGKFQETKGSKFQPPNFYGVIYVSGEESAAQVGERIERLGLFVNKKTFQFANESDIDSIIQAAKAEQPGLLIIDSLQTMFTRQVDSEPGNPTQLKAVTTKLMEFAKTTGTVVLLVGHVTKDGTVAGPRAVEHLVDVVLYLEGDRYHQMRLLRGVKNRFGSTGAVGVLKMTQRGLEELKNPAAEFLAERAEGASGSVITTFLDGARVFVVEVQALVSRTKFQMPTRQANGIKGARLNMLLAVLNKKIDLKFGDQDVFVNVVGGFNIKEPAIDAAVCLAILSSYRDFVLPTDLAAVGEVGLAGELRNVPQLDKRLKELMSLGFKQVVLPEKNKFASKKMKLVKIGDVKALAKHFR